jgi:hypothetical protein
MSFKRLWPVVLFWLAVGGCGGAQTRAAAPEARSTAAGGVSEEAPPADHRAEIERLEREIASNTNAVRPAPPPESPPGSPTGVEPGGVPGVSRPTHDGEIVCEQACQASGSICRAAQRICTLADEMGDEWARGKCRTAQRTCTDTRRRATNACGAC